ncbi:dTDP-glucose 4,6-dehydratase [Bacillus thuringiensis]|uniref:dTDP-glucose 4,6-dehydratase n=1 Tax=Bacillus thuringiensis serovar yosoo TaxID=180848 RepID=A0A9X6FCY4_BACTU|nr:dTDP-glucose 4,6-dehydratase [Bacillus thuringiensis]OTY63063.1 dTDP-glucose 4,6-dehydratase [Bacillus thuringiensis serovar yosoo]
MKLLITGGAGFIGSNFIRYMLKKYPQYQIVNVDLLTYAGNLSNLKEISLNQNYKFIKGDISNEIFIDKLFKKEKFDYVLNFAAESHVDRSIKTPHIFVQTNILGTQALLHSAYKTKVKKFVQISTDEVYGTLSQTGAFTEHTIIAPNSPYSASKASADLMVRAYHETFGLPMNITRCSNNYGPYQFTEKLIPLTITHALNNKDIPLYGDGLHIRDWLHVEDHCVAIDLVLHDGADGHIYNIGGDNEYTNLDIVQKILKFLNKDQSQITFISDRLGHDRRYAMDATKLKEELGWKPQYLFDNGLTQTIKWYIDNRTWWE